MLRFSLRRSCAALGLFVLCAITLLSGSRARADGETWSLAYPPTAVWKHAMIYDAPRHRVIVSGGFVDVNQNVLSPETWALPLQGERVWTKLTTSPTSAVAGSGIYDPVRDRMVVFDGNTVTVLPLATPSSWSTLTTVGTPPPGAGHLVYEPGADRMLVLLPGGATYSLSFASATATWSQLATTGAGTGGTSATVILDPVRNRLIACAGGTVNVGVGVWELPLGTLAWHQLSFTGLQPQVRVFATAIYDPNGDRMILFGGEPDYGALNDTWALSLAGTPAWTPLGSSRTPQGRWLHTAVCDPDGQQMIVFGGNPSPNLSSPLNDTWALPLIGPSEWASIPGDGLAPSGRWSHSAVYDPIRDRMIVFGGYGGASFTNEAWVLWLGEGRHWERLTPAGAPPSARYLHTAIWDAVGNRMIVFGGYDGASYRNDLWALSFDGSPSWIPLAASGTPPDRRAKHSAVLDPATRRMLVFGGETAGGVPQQDFWSLDLTSDPPAWTQIAAGGAPQARIWHTAVYDSKRDRMLVFGGRGASTPVLSDVWSYTTAGGWSNITSATTPKLFAHAAVLDPLRDRMLVFAGDDGSGYPPTNVYAMGLDGTSWQYLAVGGTQRPPGTFNNFFSAIYDALDDQVITFGGTNQGVYLSPPGPWQMSATRPLAAPREWAGARDFSLLVGPQPSRGVAHIKFELPSAGATRLGVFDVSGRCVKTLVAGTLAAGRHEALWEATGAGAPRAGVYFLRLEHGGSSASRPIVLAR